MFVLFVILVLVLLGVVPIWPHSRRQDGSVR
jgi:Protein of unknown function (DUF3309)